MVIKCNGMNLCDIAKKDCNVPKDVFEKDRQFHMESR